jgi:hypothetical protein
MALTGCGLWPANPSRTLEVDEVLKSIHVLDGETVKVRGYMASCAGYDCGLFASEQAHKDFWRVLESRNANQETPDFLSIGYNDEFDRKAGPLAGRYVVVTGRVNDECRDVRGQPLCTDRSPDLEPIAISLDDLKAPGSRQVQ